MRSFTVWGLMLALGLTACKDEQKPADVTTSADPIEVGNYTPSEAYYQCGEELVSFITSGDGRADMRIANTTFAMQQAQAASGVKYENLGDGETFFWNKGNEVLVSVNSKVLPVCMEVDEPEAVTSYKAVGNEPGWLAVVEKNSLELILDYGEKNAVLPVVSDEASGNERVISAQEGSNSAKMFIHSQACVDMMSGEPFAHQVRVEYNGATYEGCGQSLIRDVAFMLQSMNGSEVIEGSRITLSFDSEGRLGGNGGCNQYGGSYTLEGSTLYVHPDLISTMKACADEAMMAQEQAFLRLLPSMKTASVEQEGGQLILYGNQSEQMLFTKE